ncbi:MAG: leucine-rich repeat domain-containing protein [Oscillospiraceae bacterium]|jgi:Leucine-rich repeat (LRR) protein|nr:leucine-rich repeat domain-containing protein [Oscillospiraceae bacterium]
MIRQTEGLPGRSLRRGSANHGRMLVDIQKLGGGGMEEKAQEKKTYFISYTGCDLEWAKWIESVVRLRMGASTIIQEYDFHAGENFREKMHEALKKADYVLGVMTPDYMASSNCTDEWTNTKRGQFIPILCAGFEPDGLLTAVIYIKVHDKDAEDAAQELLKGLQGVPRPTQEHPFPGMTGLKEEAFFSSTADAPRNQMVTPKTNPMTSVRPKKSVKMVKIISTIVGILSLAVAIYFCIRALPSSPPKPNPSAHRADAPTPTPTEFVLPYTNISPNEPHYDAVVYVYTYELFSEDSRRVKEFGGLVYRLEAIMALHRMMGTPRPTTAKTFFDLNMNAIGHNAANAVNWAAEQDLIVQTYVQYDKEKDISGAMFREYDFHYIDLAAMLYQLAEKAGLAYLLDPFMPNTDVTLIEMQGHAILKALDISYEPNQLYFKVNRKDFAVLLYAYHNWYIEKINNQTIPATETLVIAGMEVSIDAENVNLSGLDISDLTYIVDALGQMKNLQSLDLSINRISDITPLRALKSLQVLNLANNQIANLSVLSDFSELISLNLNSNDIMDIRPLGNLTQLTALYLYNNAISEFDALITLKSLKHLSLNHAGAVSRLDFLSDMHDLESLIMSGAEWIEGAVSLSEGFVVDKVVLTSLEPLKNLKKLKKLSLLSLPIADLEALIGLEALDELTIAFSNIADIEALANLTNLVKLDLTHNQISDIEPLAGLVHIQELSLSFNSINNLAPLANLSEVQVLDLAYNDMSDLTSLYGLYRLEELSLVGMFSLSDMSYDEIDALIDEKISTLQQALPHVKINY